MFATTADVAALRAPAHAPVARRGAVATVAKESRIGKQPVKVPKGVTVKIEGQKVSAKVRGHAPASPPWLARRPRMPAPAAAFTARCAAFRAGPPPGRVPRRCPGAIAARDRGIRPAVARAALGFRQRLLTLSLSSPARRVRRGSCRPALTTACRSSRCGRCSRRRAQRRCTSSLTRWAARCFGCSRAAPRAGGGRQPALPPQGRDEEGVPAARPVSVRGAPQRCREARIRACAPPALSRVEPRADAPLSRCAARSRTT